MNTILIPTNFSENSYRIVDYVIELFKNESCAFYLFNSYSYGVKGLDAIELLQADEEWFEIPEEESLKKLEKLLDYYKLKSNNVNHTFYTVSKSIDLVDGIKEILEKIGANLLILTGNIEKIIGKNNEHILGKIRNIPILIIPPTASSNEKLNLTIVSDFKQKLSTIDIDIFCKVFENTNFEVKILVLEFQNELTIQAANNLESLIINLKQEVSIEYIKLTFSFIDYIAFDLEGIICIVDENPDLFRIVGLTKSNLTSKIENSYSNPVLVLHQ
ncbi:MAG: hypothetical protein ACJAYP_001409 [Flavobacterium sp.]|jgi:hypothetical protein